MFDEATSNIDTETEVKIREALDDVRKGGQPSLLPIVSPRSTVWIASSSWTMDVWLRTEHMRR